MAVSNIVVLNLVNVRHFLIAEHVVCRLFEGDNGFAVCVVGLRCLMLHAPKQLKLPWLGGS